MSTGVLSGVKSEIFNGLSFKTTDKCLFFFNRTCFLHNLLMCVFCSHQFKSFCGFTSFKSHRRPAKRKNEFVLIVSCQLTQCSLPPAAGEAEQRSVQTTLFFFLFQTDSLGHLLKLTVLFLNRSQHKLSDIVAYFRFASHAPVYKRA